MNKKILLGIIILVLIITLIALVIFLSRETVLDVEEVSSAHVTIRDINYNDRRINESITLEVQNESDISLLLELEKKAIKYKSPRGINLAPWEMKIVYSLKNGETVEKEYVKAGNDSMFEPLLDAVYNG